MMTGAIVAQLLDSVTALNFLTKSTQIVWKPSADINFLKYDFYIQVKLNLLHIIGLVTAFWIYRRI